ncbi:MAG: nicotinamide mononucleotide transporter [Alphaproteobacteria bacterium]|nr:nicotinamide mononucleotide transporter [Alphaproteobacteria bacterium]
MTLNDIGEYFLNNRVETVATLLGVVNIMLLIRQNIWNFPVGIVMVILFGWVVWDAKLYSDFGLQIFFLLLQCYGWINWARGQGGRDAQHDDILPVSLMTLPQRLRWLGIAGVGVMILGVLMARYTNAALPYWDAVTTVLSVIAQYFLARKYLENWLLWLAVDVLAIAIYAVKELYIFSGLYSFFLVLAGMGLVAWWRSISPEMKNPERC